MASEISRKDLRKDIEAVRQAKPKEGAIEVLDLGLPAVRGRYVKSSGGLLLPESVVLNPEEVKRLEVGVEGRILVKSVGGMGDGFRDLGTKLGEKAQELASQQGKEFKDGVIRLGMIEFGINAIKNGMQYSGEPVSVEWKLGPEVCEFIITDSGKRDFDPLKYPKMPLEQILDLPDVNSNQGHMGIRMLYGSIAPGEETEGLLRREDIQWTPIRNARGDRIGTKMEFRIRSTEKTKMG